MGSAKLCHDHTPAIPLPNAFVQTHAELCLFPVEASAQPWSLASSVLFVCLPLILEGRFSAHWTKGCHCCTIFCHIVCTSANTLVVVKSKIASWCSSISNELMDGENDIFLRDQALFASQFLPRLQADKLLHVRSLANVCHLHLFPVSHTPHLAWRRTHTRVLTSNTAHALHLVPFPSLQLAAIFTTQPACPKTPPT